MTPWASFEAHRRAREGAASNEEYDDAISGDLRALNFDPEHMAKTLSDTKPNESLERDRRRCLRGTLQTHTLLYRECGNETESVAHPHTHRSRSCLVVGRRGGGRAAWASTSALCRSRGGGARRADAGSF